MKGKLILENGMVFEGKIFGELGGTVGELVFNTGMTGYQELLTDPSYCGQIVVMTYPMVGNYGINLEDMESDGIKLKGFIIKEDAKLPNNFRCEMTLDGFLRQHKVVGFKGIDTRHLTKIIREQGAMKALITTEELTQKEIDAHFNKFNNIDAVETVSTKETYEIPGEGKKIGVIDFGVKRNILRNFSKRGYSMVVFPWNVTAEEVLSHKLDGVFLSNGPGDPAELTEVINEIKKLVGKLPIVGICLGHQLLAWALGGTTKKLKYGHRGCNHPVKDLDRNKIYITSQNHGYVVDKVPESMRVTHINLNDNSIEGMKSDELRIMCVQYHPEAWPGPSDSEYLFDDFLKVIEGDK
ncbi:MAG: glutamine-hydrolyzing carbamoyl-phosphate synthase small subunit [Cetobacterium sp.]|uniref:glutamine-hydrolyzing carbamoyl-phosphate synthase small subunit n=1 Tax=unclassified Cetobacterium TaxID=2630983 RepID=UPI00163C4A4D|nr:glutamine-hydrolyzing carbamoyl-phosphate synthase small subunit [Cetobacterium sp. 2A]MBC2856658.1 glutamine-hydrolyzing carbamoyl-phosphate synthase small subunit [Cetobacterium sp. 2A]